MEGSVGKKGKATGEGRRKGSVPGGKVGGGRDEEEAHFPPRLPSKSNSLPSLTLDDVPSTLAVKERMRLSSASNASLRATVPLKAVYIGEKVNLESVHPQSLSFSQYFLTTIQRKQRTAEKGLRGLKLPPKAASVNTSAIHLTHDLDRKDPLFPLKRDKPPTPLRMHLCKVRKPQKPAIAVGITLPSERHPRTDELYRAKSAISLYRIRKSRQKPQIKPVGGEVGGLEQPLKDHILVSKLVSPLVELKGKTRKGLLNVTYVQCQPYRIPIDFCLFRNVKKLFGTRLRAMFDMS